MLGVEIAAQVEPLRPAEGSQPGERVFFGEDGSEQPVPESPNKVRMPATSIHFAQAFVMFCKAINGYVSQFRSYCDCVVVASAQKHIASSVFIVLIYASFKT